MNTGDTATYGHVALHGFDQSLRINFECLEVRTFQNALGHDLTQWRIRVEAHDYLNDEIVAWKDVIISIVDQSDVVAENPFNDHEIGSETMIWVVDDDDEESWSVNHDGEVIQYSKYGQLDTITSAVLSLLEDIHLVF